MGIADLEWQRTLARVLARVRAEFEMLCRWRVQTGAAQQPRTPIWACQELFSQVVPSREGPPKSWCHNTRRRYKPAGGMGLGLLGAQLLSETSTDIPMEWYLCLPVNHSPVFHDLRMVPVQPIGRTTTSTFQSTPAGPDRWVWAAAFRVAYQPQADAVVKTANLGGEGPMVLRHRGTTFWEGMRNVCYNVVNGEPNRGD